MNRNPPDVFGAAGAAGVPPGPNAGRLWHEPPVGRRDPVSRRTVWRLTHYRGHSHHCAGSQPCWLEGGRRLVLVADRDGWGNLFDYDFSRRTLRQLTDLRGSDRPRQAAVTGGSEIGFWYGDDQFELELSGLRIRRSASKVLDPGESCLASAWQTGVASLVDGRSVLWVARATDAPRDRRVAAVTGGSGRPPFAAVHPCVRPGTDEVIFVSDAEGYAQIYAVAIGRLAALPKLTDIASGRYSEPVAVSGVPLSRRAASGPRPTRPRA